MTVYGDKECDIERKWGLHASEQVWIRMVAQHAVMSTMMHAFKFSESNRHGWQPDSDGNVGSVMAPRAGDYYHSSTTCCSAVRCSRST